MLKQTKKSVWCLVAVLGCLMAQARMIEIAGTNVVNDVVASVDLAFGPAAEDETNHLYVAYGTAPGGDSAAGWEHVYLLATVPPEETARNIPMPDGWEKPFRAIRFFLLPPPAVYDHAVMYLESTGKEWINTRVTHTTATSIFCELEILSDPVGAYNVPFGSRRVYTNGDYPGSLYFFSRYNNESKPGFRRGLGGREAFGAVGALPFNVPVSISVEGRTATWSVAGATVGSLTSTNGTDDDGDAPMFLFTMNEASSAGGADVNAACNTKMRLRSFKMMDDGTMRCDFVPVVANGVGVLYDRVSGSLFGNDSGTGAFKVGPVTFSAEEVGSSTPAFVLAPERTISVADTNVVEGLAVSLELAFGAGTPGRTNILFAAYGPMAGGRGAGGWAHCERVAEIAPETATFTYALPAGWGAENKALRFFFAAPGNGYDSAVEYLESTGAEWVNTECRHTASTLVTCVADILSDTVGAYNTPFGSRSSGMSGGLYFFTLYASDAKPGYGRGKKEAFGSVGGFPRDVQLTICTQGDTAWWATNHVRIGSVTPAASSEYDAYGSMFVFSMNEVSAVDDVTPNTACNTKMRLRTFRMEETSGGVLCDLKPVVRKGEGMLYDSVTGTLRGNGSGGGAFICGPLCYGGERIRAESETVQVEESAPMARTARYRSLVSFKAYGGTEHLVGFPALIFLSPDAVEGFQYAQCAADGADIRFTDLAGNLLPHEIDTWNTNGTSLVWVRLPALDPAGTRAWMGWGERRQMPAARPPQEVWSDYLAVWHFSEESGTAHDSGPFGFDAVPQGETAAASVGTNVITLGRSRYVPGCWFDAGAYARAAVGSAFSASGWFRMTDGYVQKDSPLFFSNKTLYNDATGWYVAMQDGPNCYSVNGGGGISPKTSPGAVRDLWTNWSYLAAAFDGRSCSFYENRGSELVCAMKAEIQRVRERVDTLKLFHDTYGKYQGFADEMRIRIGATSADRILADLKTMADASFATFGAAENLYPPGMAVIVR